MCASSSRSSSVIVDRGCVKKLCKSATVGSVDFESAAGWIEGERVMTYELEVRLLTRDERHDGQLYRSLPCLLKIDAFEMQKWEVRLEISGQVNSVVEPSCLELGLGWSRKSRV
jgi:hypothetical protein